ncbi:MAG: class I SAM-dependent methyltransferase [Asticcacaulis sp.]
MSPGMLAQARAKLAGFDVLLVERDIMAGGNDLGLYDVVVTALVMEHIEDIITFFARVAASLKPGGRFFMSEVEPARLAAGGVARFYDPVTGERHDMKSFAHDAAAILAAAGASGLTSLREQDVLGDARLTLIKPEWARHDGKPMIRMWEFANDRQAPCSQPPGPCATISAT